MNAILASSQCIRGLPAPAALPPARAFFQIRALAPKLSDDRGARSRYMTFRLDCSMLRVSQYSAISISASFSTVGIAGTPVGWMFREDLYQVSLSLLLLLPPAL